MGFALKYGHTYKTKVKDYIRLIKESGCDICGYKKCLDALEFHHVNDNKKSELSKINRLSTAKQEIEKCILVCANCHREIHSGSVDGLGDVQTFRNRLHKNQGNLFG